MRDLIRTLDRYWFNPAPATRLAAVRVVAGTFALWHLGRRAKMLDRIATETDPALFEPTGVVRVLDGALPPPLARVTVLATLGANAAFVLGWRHRQTGPLFAGLLLWTMSYRNSWSMIHHSSNVTVLHVAILGLTPAADALSLDSVSGRITRSPLPASHWRYGWPLSLMSATTAVTYLLAGVAKVKGPLGWRWAGGDALRRHVAMDGLRKELLGKGAAPLGASLYHRVGLYRLLAVASLAAELGAPLALANRRVSRLWALSAWVMHWGIYVVMKISFPYQMSGAMYASYFELERVLQHPRRWLGAQLRGRSYL